MNLKKSLWLDRGKGQGGSNDLWRVKGKTEEGACSRYVVKLAICLPHGLTVLTDENSFVFQRFIHF